MKIRQRNGVPMLAVILGLVLGLPVTSPVAAQQQSDETPADESAVEKPAYMAELEKRLSDTTWSGRFSVDGNDELKSEQYQVKSVTKLPNGDTWMFQTRIKYGDHDITVPLPITIKWANQTPVITLDDLTIPGLGTFSARVVIHEDRYAGTWQHGDVGGHLFGAIEATEQR